MVLSQKTNMGIQANTPSLKNPAVKHLQDYLKKERFLIKD